MPTTNNHSQYCKSLRELASFLNTDHSTLLAWKERGCPLKKTSKGYFAPSVAKWILKNINRKKGRRKKFKNPELEQRYQKASLLELESRTELLKLKLKLLKGELIPLDQVIERDVNRILTFKESLLNLTRTLPQNLIGLNENQIKEKLLHHFSKLITQFKSM